MPAVVSRLFDHRAKRDADLERKREEKFLNDTQPVMFTKKGPKSATPLYKRLDEVIASKNKKIERHRKQFEDQK